jgi:hypothetical protein
MKSPKSKNKKGFMASETPTAPTTKKRNDVDLI